VPNGRRGPSAGLARIDSIRDRISFKGRCPDKNFRMPREGFEFAREQRNKPATMDLPPLTQFEKIFMLLIAVAALVAVAVAMHQLGGTWPHSGPGGSVR
jgi:hypothetical protein